MDDARFWTRRAPAPASPPLIDTDEIIPFYFKDDSLMKGVLLNVAWRYDVVLDEKILRDSLEQLIENHGEWRKLGARIRKNRKGKLEHHIPARFDRQTRPSVDWTHTKLNMSIDDHPAARGIPRPSATPTTFPMPAATTDLVALHGITQQGLALWTLTDRPLLIVELISFTDATLICIVHNHAAFDGMGLGAIMRGWTAVVNGREDQIPPFAAFSEDPLAPLAERTPGTRYALSHLIASSTSFIKYAFSSLWEMLWYPSEMRLICFPESYMKTLQQQAILDAERSALPDEKIWLSEGDVSLAWWAQTISESLQLPDHTPVALMNAMDIRDFTDGKIPRGSVYLGNAIDTAMTFISARELRQKSCGEVALQTRRDMLLLRQQDQIEAKMQLDKQAGGTVFLGPSDQVQLLYSNWRKVGHMDHDFSGAIVTGEKSRAQVSTSIAPEKPSFLYFNPVARLELRNAGVLCGRDVAGNSWMTWRLRKSAWPVVERALAQMKCSR